MDDAPEIRNSNKEPVEGPEALTLLDGLSSMFVAKGKRIIEVDLKKNRPSDDELLELMLGRSGKLRAPTIRSGQKLLVGFNQELLESHLL